MPSHSLLGALSREKWTADLEKENEGSEISPLRRERHHGIYSDSRASAILKDLQSEILHFMVREEKKKK